MKTHVYEFVYELLTGFIFPVEGNLPYWDIILNSLCFCVTLGIFWVCFLKPFYLIFKYGLFGGSKKNPLTKKRKDDWNEDN